VAVVSQRATTAKRLGSPEPKRDVDCEINLWAPARYGLVNVQMLKALLHAAKTTG
jgi:hypothetical protein